VSELAGAIDASAHPALVTVRRSGGSGWVQAVALAEKLDAPVWAAPSSERAPFPETHPLNLGGLPFAKGPLAEKLAGHDLVVVIGASVFRYYPFVDGPYLPDGAKLWQVTDDPEEAARAPVGESLLGDAVLAIEQLTARLARVDVKRPLPRRWPTGWHRTRRVRPTAPTKGFAPGMFRSTS
jgi:benzoylformate decarboxylase